MIRIEGGPRTRVRVIGSRLPGSTFKVPDKTDVVGLGVADRVADRVEITYTQALLMSVE